MLFIWKIDRKRILAECSGNLAPAAGPGWLWKTPAEGDGRVAPSIEYSSGVRGPNARKHDVAATRDGATAAQTASSPADKLGNPLPNAHPPSGRCSFFRPNLLPSAPYPTPAPAVSNPRRGPTRQDQATLPRRTRGPDRARAIKHASPSHSRVQTQIQAEADKNFRRSRSK